ncbi:MAG: type VI secretion system contractile sheath small subunit [Klebsiella michiganensis]|nr:type VI secretion system contractile sheath small subunit [Klebsiella michiganensis]
MADTFQNEVPKARINLKLALHTGGAQKKVELPVQNTLAGDSAEENIQLRFADMKDFEPEQVARQIPQLRAMLAMRNLLRDLKSNLLDNATFRKELEKILKDPALTQELRDEMSALAPK